VAAEAGPPPLLEVTGLRLAATENGRTGDEVVRGVSFSIRRGQRVALVGESGSGKSLTALACLGLTPETIRLTGGRLRVDGEDLLSLPEAAARRLRGGRIGLVFQEPASSLNPVLSIGYQIRETLQAHRGVERSAARREALDLLREVGLEPAREMARAYPHQLSGGQAQRAALAVALAPRPSLLIADEPTTGLDATTQHAILDLLLRLSTGRGMALLVITHDMAVAAVLAHSGLIMYAGELVETGPMETLLSAPAHPYTRLLMGTADPAGFGPASTGSATAGCAFAPRCPLRRPACLDRHPALQTAGPDHLVRCPVTLQGGAP
jgi:oligopeptide/dipeptide ABC transporter ATP-binding protein